jgi:hypothetical protein
VVAVKPGLDSQNIRASPYNTMITAKILAEIEAEEFLDRH